MKYFFVQSLYVLSIDIAESKLIGCEECDSIVT